MITLSALFLSMAGSAGGAALCFWLGHFVTMASLDQYIKSAISDGIYKGAANV
ncbi:MAG: hypothetical protein WA173_14230 [Pseudomonas sp.]|uniref:hypothetical protein n=1 Tax=Pseudomonas sp. TaxID=306 RepID=UPI003BB5A096